MPYAGRWALAMTPTPSPRPPRRQVWHSPKFSAGSDLPAPAVHLASHDTLGPGGGNGRASKVTRIVVILPASMWL